MGGIARQNGIRALAIGGVEDHVHLLLSLPATMPVAKAVQLIKAGSSKMVRQTFTPMFEWQEGYASFSVGVSQVGRTVAYIRSQAEHHRKGSFREELEAFCKKHGIALRPQD
jgi:REP element-mobilizing transposase RayT